MKSNPSSTKTKVMPCSRTTLSASITTSEIYIPLCSYVKLYAHLLAQKWPMAKQYSHRNNPQVHRIYQELINLAGPLYATEYFVL